MHVTFVFCEGAHDIAFLSRLLTKLGRCTEYRKTLEAYPTPLGNFLAKRLEQRPVQSLPVRDLQRGDPPVLESVLQSSTDANAKKIYLFLNCHGQDRHGCIKELLVQFAKLWSSNFGTNPNSTTSMQRWSMAFFYDADSIGVDGTLDQFKARYADVLGDLTPLTSRSWIRTVITAREGKTVDCDVGCFIFSAPGATQGTLEDGLLAMLHDEDGRLFDASTAFIDGHALAGCAVTRGPDSKRKKAIVTAAAQFDHPSYSMAVFLRDTKMLTSETLYANEMCEAIISFFEGPGSEEEAPPASTAIASEHDAG